MSEGAFLDVVTDFKNELTIYWPGKHILSPTIVAQCCFKSGSGTVKPIFWYLYYVLMRTGIQILGGS